MDRIGVDLGTYNSAAAVALGRDKIVMIESRYGQSLYGKNFPSFVLFDHNGKKQMVGKLAKAEGFKNPKLLIWGVKRLVGLSYKEAKERGELERFQYDIEEGPRGGIIIRVGPECYTPSHILEFILREIKEDAENPKVNPLIGKPIEKAVISVPAYFYATRTASIKEAAQQAGFSGVKIIAEPTAAAIRYGLKINQEAILLTFDLGGGTLDVTLLQVILDDKGELIAGELCTSGHEALGGIDMDDMLLNYVIDKYRLSAIKQDVEKMSLLKSEIEMAKIRLSSRGVVPIDLPEGDSVDLTQKELTEVLRPILDKCRGPIRVALQKSKLNARDIDHVLFVGGPTRMPCVRETVKDELKTLGAKREVLGEIDTVEKEVFALINPMECVAQGAALMSAEISMPESVVIAEGYGTIFWPVKGFPDYYAAIIEVNSRYPISGSEEIIHNNLKVLQVNVPIVAKRIDPDKTTASQIVYSYVHLGDFTISIAPTTEKPLVNIRLEVTEDKMLIATLTHVQTGHKVTYEALNELSGEKKDLQEHTQPDAIKQQDGSDMPDKASWTKKQLEDLIHIAKTAMGLSGARANSAIEKKKDEVESAIKEAIDSNYANINNDCPKISNRLKEFLNTLFKFKEISEKDFRNYINELTKIAENK